VKCALTTDTLGWDGSRVAQLVADEFLWQERLQEFAAYRGSWERDGFYFMFSQLLRQEKVIENLLRFTDAERRITNVLHLAELLEAVSRAEHLGADQLVQWLEKRRASDEAAADEFQLRLESDEDAVQIVTIHRAKGLEYPVVFCPFVTRDAKISQIKVERKPIMDIVLFHDPVSKELTWDLNPMSPHTSQARTEQLAESVRLLYVALTRARHRCYLVSAPSNKKKSTALAWLLNDHGGNISNPIEFLDSLGANPMDWHNRWLALSEKSPVSIKVADVPLTAGEQWSPERPAKRKLISKSCDREIKPSWFLSSFTQLSQQVLSPHETADATDLPDYDTTTVKPKPDASEKQLATGIFALPAGARTGDCLHKILEQYDFASDDKAPVMLLVKQQLGAFGLDEPQNVEAVTKMLEWLRQTPLNFKNPNFTLACVRRLQQLSEMEFYFPTGQFEAEKLLQMIRDNNNSPAPGRATLPRVEGFLKGFIDLIFEFENRFYIVDWKSNSLGNSVEDYNAAAMRHEIAERGYDLQYHIYTVALDKYLRARLANYDYEKHFGGVRYIFLRGLAPEKPELGIFCDRPSAEKIAGLSSLLGNFAEAKS
jgi:exodeoxyribonuclease V beta subunit